MKSSVNKGFFTYLILFVFLILGAVLVSATILMFSPGSATILGYAFAADNSHVIITTRDGVDEMKTAGASVVMLDAEGEVIDATGNLGLNFSSLSELVIKTNGINVNVIHSGEDKIEIKRKVRGFDKAENIKELEITKQHIAGQLIITAYDSTPKYRLSNNSVMTVYVKDSNTSNLKIDVESKTAGLNIATSEFNPSVSRDLTFKAVDFKTVSGNFSISSVGKVNQSLSIKSEGKTVAKLANDFGSVQNRMESVSFNMAEGRVEGQNIATKQMMLKAENAFVSFKDVDVSKVLNDETNVVNFAIKKGDFKVDNFTGNLHDKDEVVDNTAIKIKKVDGDFTVSKTDVKKGNKADVLIDEITGLATISTSKGTVKIKSAHNKVLVETVSGAVFLKMEQSNTSNFNIKTTSGNVNLLLDNVSLANKVEIEKGGNIKVFYKSSLDNFTIKAKSSKGKVNFPADNYSEKGVEVIGYPTLSSSQPEEAHSVIVDLKTTANIKVEPVSNTNWEKL